MTLLPRLDDLTEHNCLAPALFGCSCEMKSDPKMLADPTAEEKQYLERVIAGDSLLPLRSLPVRFNPSGGRFGETVTAQLQ